MRKVVIHGIVEHLDEQQIAARSQSLHAALQRMTVSRELRDISAAAEERPIFEREELNERRRRIFHFGLRARRAVDEL